MTSSPLSFRSLLFSHDFRWQTLKPDRINDGVIGVNFVVKIDSRYACVCVRMRRNKNGIPALTMRMFFDAIQMYDGFECECAVRKGLLWRAERVEFLTKPFKSFVSVMLFCIVCRLCRANCECCVVCVYDRNKHTDDIDDSHRVRRTQTDQFNP